MKNKPLISIIGTVVAIIFWAVSRFFELELFEKIINILEKFEKYEIDELIIPLMIIVFSVLIDLIRISNQTKVENEKMKIYKAMVFSTHHILNNFLNQMQLFKMTAEDTSEFPQDVVNLFDTTIEEASSQIDALANISKVDEEAIHDTVKP